MRVCGQRHNHGLVGSVHVLHAGAVVGMRVGMSPTCRPAMRMGVASALSCPPPASAKHACCAPPPALQVSTKDTEEQIKKMQDKYGVDGAQHGKAS